MTKLGRVVVVGTSAGGMETLRDLVAQLPATFSAPIFVVQHMAPNADAAVLVAHLSKHSALRCTVAKNGERFASGKVYIAPADHHLLIKGTTLLVSKGARENRYRPAIDPMFRSAAVSHGSRVISVVLTGNLDDGTEGTSAVKRCGGTTVIQEPGDAAYPAMPESARAVGVDHTVPLRELGVLLDRLVRTRPGKKRRVPDDIRMEATIAERVLSDVAAVEALGEQVPYNCPNCGGVLWEMDTSDTLRFRCHTGHSYTAPSLLAEQSGKIEETLWVTLRMLEERRNLLRSMRKKGQSTQSATEREQDTETHIERIRAILLAGGRSI
ncbi:MAG: chemotaxis protein CheB [Deltaproteobacteria bacterium]|nr:chemotaxis protein CheB [Deltaproteobacteria bacterium]